MCAAGGRRHSRRIQSAQDVVAVDDVSDGCADPAAAVPSVVTVAGPSTRL